MTTVDKISQFDTVVVGGGVSGMYSAWCLAEAGQKVALFEKSDRWGGRIETVMMGEQKFKAEFGPMRFEEKGQVLLVDLLNKLGLEFSPFPQYQSAKPEWPMYNITDHEERRWQEDPLLLLLMGILKVLGRYRDGMTAYDMFEQVHDLPESKYPEMRKSACFPEHKKLYTRGFWNALGDALSYPAVMKIRDMGNFYHLIPENPNAIEWIIFWLRGLQPCDRLVGVKGGSMSISEGLCRKLSKYVGAGNLTQKENHELISLRQEGSLLKLSFHGEIKEVTARHVILALPKSPLEHLAHNFPRQIQDDLDAVIAFPLLKCFFVVRKPWWNEDTKPQTGAYSLPTRELHYYQEHVLQLSEACREDLRTCTFSESLRKEFLEKASLELPADMKVTPKRDLSKRDPSELCKNSSDDACVDPEGLGWQIFSQGEPGEHRYYVQEEDLSVFDKNGMGMVMVYTDRPATEYWNDYILDREKHDRAEINGDTRLVDRFLKYLAEPLTRELQGRNVETLPNRLSPFVGKTETEVLEALEQEVVEFGIRDWGREPYGAGCHVWRPNTKSWEVIERLKGFDITTEKHPNGTDDPSGQRSQVHICGEAHSDYQGFIEGALRTANGVLKTIGVPRLVTGGSGERPGDL